MDFILRGYEVNDATWFYLSFLLIIAVYFKFNRFWSIRNVDLTLLLSISPGLLLARLDETQTLGYVWLFVTTGLFLVRALSDVLLTRRPRLEQNMNAAGMAFLCAATFLFLTTKLLTERPPESMVESVRKATALIEGERVEPAELSVTLEADDAKRAEDKAPAGPGTSLVAASLSKLSQVVSKPDRSKIDLDVVTARLTAIMAHLAVILGLTLVGRHIFGDADLGFAMATLYMLLPCTAYDVGKVSHVLPAALVVWAIWCYRRPFISGLLMGLACAFMFFPIFLLPLWTAFYGRRGGLRFVAAVGLATAVIVSSLVLLSADTQSFVEQTLGYVPWTTLKFWSAEQLSGIWNATGDDNPTLFVWRIPVFVTYIVMLVSLTVWPRKKSLAQVIPHSAAIIIGTQFWYPQQGGVYVLWYLPLLLLVVFRPLMANHFASELESLTFFSRLKKQHATAELTASVVGSTAPQP